MSVSCCALLSKDMGVSSHVAHPSYPPPNQYQINPTGRAKGRKCCGKRSLLGARQCHPIGYDMVWRMWKMRYRKSRCACCPSILVLALIGIHPPGDGGISRDTENGHWRSLLGLGWEEEAHTFSSEIAVLDVFSVSCNVPQRGVCYPLLVWDR
jgi:hypothetical protein